MKNYILIAGLFFSFPCLAQKPAYLNTELSSEERAKDLIARLTLEEKASLMQDQSPAISRLGIKKFNWWSEALHGLANNDAVTVFPEPVGMAASFDDTLVYRVFDAVSDETRARYQETIKKGQENRRFLSLSVWTPNINIFRDPRWGRGQETYGEDPYLTSRMGVSVVKGLQGPADAKYRKLLACAKHFAVHSGPEWSRHTLDLSNVSSRDLWETYLPAFKSLVKDADVREVMCAYQRLDDEPCCGNNRLLQTILREDWGFKYLVVSDCGAVTDFYTSHKVSSDAIHASAKAVLAGTDVECVWEGYAFKNLPGAVAKGLITEQEINKHLTRVLSGRFDLGEFDDDALVPWANIPASVINNPEHRKLALDIARESITLLQNKNNILPLSKRLKKIAVIGPNADNETVLWGNYNGKPVTTKGRTYRYLQSDPLFQFGYGLSYTSFSIGNALLSKSVIHTGDTITLTLPVTNTGKIDGAEIVQVYIKKVKDAGGPVRTLRGFRRTDVAAGKTVNAVINLPFSAFEFYDEKLLQMTVTPGEYEIGVGNSSAAKDLKITSVTIM